MYRLLHKGVCGKVVRAMGCMYAAANSCVEVAKLNLKSAPFPVRSEFGVAQSCQLSPFLCAVFIDSVLDDLYALAPQPVIRVSGSDWLHPWQRQLHADDKFVAVTLYVVLVLTIFCNTSVWIPGSNHP